jgi:hypothetical protein
VMVVMVVVGACSWWSVLRYWHTSVLHHLWAAPVQGQESMRQFKIL